MLHAWRFGDHDNLLHFQSKKVLDEEVLNDGSDVDSDELSDGNYSHGKLSDRSVVNIVVNNINKRYFPELSLYSSSHFSGL